MVRTRIAPSPTGEDLHIGNLYTGMLNYAFAKRYKGAFIIRIEDTDRERFVPGAEEKILSTLKAFGLEYDEGPGKKGPFEPYIQSERLSYYRKYSEELIEKGSAYYCFCTKERLDAMRKERIAKKMTPKYDRYCLKDITNAKERVKKGEKHVIRLKIPDNKEVVFHDVIHGDIRVNSNQLDDQVLLKSDGYPTYHLGVVVDDHLMEITHVIRAEEWISSTPKHVILYQAFGWNLPIFAHVPILRNPDRSKLSKRKNPVWASWYLQEGFLPEAVLNFLALLGWSHPKEKEKFDLNEFIGLFELKDIHPVGPIFDIKKLEWMNGLYIRSLSASELKHRLIKYADRKKSNLYENEKTLEKVVPLLQTRMTKLSQVFDLTNWLFNTSFSVSLENAQKDIARDLLAQFEKVKVWDSKSILEVLKKIISTYSIKMKILYLIFTGKDSGLPLPGCLEILGRENVIKRLKNTVQ